MRKLFVVFIFFLLTLPAVRDLLSPAAYTSHDLTHHIVRTIQMDKILKEGQFPPRWTGDLNFGFGYPLFLFNYPFPSVLAAGVHLFGFSYIWSVKLTFLLSMIISAFFAFILFSYLFKSGLAGFVGGLFYLYAPIRFLNVYVSATFGNAVAFTFVPLVFWAIIKVYRGDVDRKIIFGGISLALLILSHNIMAVMFLPIIGVFALLLFFKKPKFVYVKYMLFIFGIGFTLSAFFLLPAAIEKSLIRYDDLLVDFWGSNFPTLWQLIHSHWGYGFSHPGTLEDDMSFQIGLAHIFVVLVSVVFVIYRFIRHRKIDIVSIFFISVFFASVFLMLAESSYFWKTVPFLSYLQMPWRLLAVSVFAASFLASYIVARSKNNFILVLFLIILVFYANRNHMKINQIFDVGDDFYMRINNSTTMASEHLPKGSDKFTEDVVSKVKVESFNKETQVEVLKNTSGEVSAYFNNDRVDVLKFNQVYLAGWQYMLDGKIVQPRFKLERPLPEFVVEPGDHTFRAYFARTRVRVVADMLSVLAVIFTSFFALRGFRYKFSRSNFFDM
ncbi:MAG: hypothetical protein AAB512_04690 [Patescibacteria group bacterium]